MDKFVIKTMNLKINLINCQKIKSNKCNKYSFLFIRNNFMNRRKLFIKMCTNLKYNFNKLINNKEFTAT